MKNPPSLRFDHVAVPVHDAKSAYQLFADTLGLPLVAAHTGDDWDGAPERKLQDAGFAIRHEDHGDQRSIYFEDRSGLTWEITTSRKSSTVDADARATVDEWIAHHR